MHGNAANTTETCKRRSKRQGSTMLAFKKHCSPTQRSTNHHAHLAQSFFRITRHVIFSQHLREPKLSDTERASCRHCRSFKHKHFYVSKHGLQCMLRWVSTAACALCTTTQKGRELSFDRTTSLRLQCKPAYVLAPRTCSKRTSPSYGKPFIGNVTGTPAS